jgi:transcriptional regulator GlxA family with amidase domain
MATQEQKTVAFVLYPGLTLLDLVGPLQVFASLRQFNDQYRPVVVAERLEPMPTDGPLTVTADQTFADVPDPEVLIVPGGDAPTIKAMGDPAIREYLRQAADTAPVVGSVCTGALVLAAAGLLEGRQATTHWAYHHPLGLSPAAGTPRRHLFAEAVGRGRQVHHLGRGVGRDRHGLGPGRPPDR